MKILSNYKPILFFLGVLLFATNCSNDESDIEQGSMVSVKIKGASGDFNQLIIDIKEVQFLVGTNPINAAWLSLETDNKGRHNISNYTEANQLILVNSALIASESIQKIKLILGDNNAIMLDGEYKPLTSDGEALEISNIITTTLEANKGYEFTIEIEADNSIFISESNIQFIPEMNTLMRHMTIG